MSVSASRYPRILVKGVRSSWATSIIRVRLSFSICSRLSDIRLKARASWPTSSLVTVGTRTAKLPAAISRLIAVIRVRGASTLRIIAKLSITARITAARHAQSR